MIEQQLTILATILLENLQETSLGHCARVDYLGRQEAIGLCQYLSTTGSHITLAARILVSSTDALLHGTFAITTDQAIELRNRKQSRVCLFVPDDMVDAAFSSLANSFELIDGRELHALVLKRMLADLPGQAQQIWRAIQQRLRRPLHVSVDRQLDLLASLSKLSEDGRLEQAGREIWRVGLVADARTDFVIYLDKNRDSVLKLSRPGKIHSTTAERIRALGVNDETFTNLAAFFRNRALHDVVSWSHDLVAEDGPTLDQWVFPLEERSDILSVKIRPFIGPDGAVVSYCKLKQPDGPGGSLRASCGPKEKMVVHWVTEPKSPANLDRWHVEMIPSGGELIDDLDLDLPATDINGSRRTSTIKLDLEFEEPPDFGLCIRVSALDAAGNTLQNDETGELINAESDEFFLVQESENIEHESRQTRRTVPTIAFGRLEVVIETRDEELAETQPQWVSQNEEFFTLRLNERRILNIATSRILVDIQRRVLADPRSGGSFEVNLDELRAIQPTDVRPSPLSPSTAEAWNPFLRARENFFGRLKKAQPRDTIEAADWTPELANMATRYGQTYRDLLDDLVTKDATRPEIMAALATDTVLLRVVTNDSVTEDALLLLPTHPLRSAWVAGYTQLLRTWETQLLQQKPQERNELINLDMVRQLAPTNTPTFAFCDLPSSPFVFFQNLQFFYGIALPPDTPDPHRRLTDIAQMLGVSSHFIGRDTRHPERLGDYLKRFWTTHSYTETLCATLVNSDDGELFVEATKQLLQPISSTEESDPSISAPSAFQLTSYVEDRRNSSGEELAGIRLLQQELVQARQSDHLLPSLTTTVRNARALYEQPLQDVHLTFVSDITRPRVVTVLEGSDSFEDVGSLTLYGLITRLVPKLSTENGELRWLHKIVTGGTGRPEPHPAGAKYSDVLVELHGAIQRAGNYFLQGPGGAQPALEVKIDLEQQQLLDQLHEHSDWVITLDRFFALDYYDSPNEAHLGNRARKYLLDYAPEFGESLGHKMMLTTNSRDEISVLLSRAMNELGFTVVDHSVRQLLHHLKTVSGHLALQALGSSTNATAAVGLGVVTAWLQSRGRLEQAVLVPVDMHPQLFSRQGSGQPGVSNRRCDLVLFALKRNIMEATFIEVKWRRGQTALDSLAEEMVLQMQSSEQAIRERFFHDKRIDAALQRGALVNVLRFYFDRARRYNIFDPQFEAAYIENLARIERNRVEFRPSYEGYIVSLEEEPRKPFSVGEAKITVLTAQDFENSTEFSAEQTRHPVAVSPTNGVDIPTGATSHLVDQDEDQVAGTSDVNTAATLDNMRGNTSDAVDAEPTIAVDEGESQPQPSVVKDESPDLQANEEVHVELGEATSGVQAEWLPSVKGSPHIFMIGIPGQGKSWTTMRILTELEAQRVPALVLDFHGQFSDPSSKFIQRAKPTILDAAAGLPFSPFESSPAAGQNEWRANAFAISEIFAYVCGLGDIQRDVVFTTIRDAYQKHGFGEEQHGKLSYPTMEEILQAIEEGESARRVANVSARLRPLLEMDLFRPLEDSPNLLEMILNGLIIDVHNVYAETAQVAIGAFVLRKLYKDMFHWGEARRLRLVVVLDEAHRLAKDITLPKLMKEGRKFGIAVVVASQGLGDFHQDVLANAGTKVIFRVNYPESRRIAGFIRAQQGQDLAKHIEQLPVGSAYVQTPEMPFGSVIKMYPP